MSKTHFSEARSFETILTLQKDLLAARAWRICYFFVGICSFLAVIILALILTQEKELVLIRVDNRTGQTEILSRLTETNTIQDEAVEKFFVSRYLTLREQYDYFSLQNDYELVQLFSSSEVKDEYLNIFSKKDSPDQLYAQAFNVRVDIVSIAISPATSPYRLASIRFRKKIHNIKHHQTKELFYSARVVFNFEAQKEMSEKLRLDNPLGFNVVSYQTAPELTED